MGRRCLREGTGRQKRRNKAWGEEEDGGVLAAGAGVDQVGGEGLSTLAGTGEAPRQARNQVGGRGSHQGRNGTKLVDGGATKAGTAPSWWTGEPPRQARQQVGGRWSHQVGGEDVVHDDEAHVAAVLRLPPVQPVEARQVRPLHPRPSPGLSGACGAAEILSPASLQRPAATCRQAQGGVRENPLHVPAAESP